MSKRIWASIYEKAYMSKPDVNPAANYDGTFQVPGVVSSSSGKPLAQKILYNCVNIFPIPKSDIRKTANERKFHKSEILSSSS